MIFVAGVRYLVTYRLDYQRIDHAFVGVYLGTNQCTGDLDFSLRPQAGTCTISRKYIKDSAETTSPCGIVYATKGKGNAKV